MTGRVLTLGLLAINLLLGLLLWMEWRADEPTMLTEVPGAASAPVEIEIAPPPPFHPAALEDYEEIVARPLFNEGRQPEVEEKVVSGPAPTKVPLTLVGVVITPERKEALVLRTGREVARLTIGESVEGWTVEAIESDRITVGSRGSAVEVMLERRAPRKAAPRRAARAKRAQRQSTKRPPKPTASAAANTKADED